MIQKNVSLLAVPIFMGSKIRENLAITLGLSIEQVSVKAKTSERLGFVMVYSNRLSCSLEIKFERDNMHI